VSTPTAADIDYFAPLDENSVISAQQQRARRFRIVDPLTRAEKEHPGQSLTMLITLVCSAVRNVRFALLRLKALELLLGFGTIVNRK
jgi:hypothetical protein